MIREQLLCFLLLSSPIVAFEDSDIDGVADRDDLCPDTPFDKLVDEDGCPEGEGYHGLFSLSIGSDIHRDEETTEDYTLLVNYHHKAFDFTLSSAKESSLDSNNDRTSSTGDLYLSTSYQTVQKHLLTTFTLGAKLPTGGEEVSTGERDYFGAINLSYLLSSKLSLIGGVSYTLTGDNNTTYQNPLGYHLGLGYMMTPNWYSRLNYSLSDSIYQDGERYQSLSLLESYSLSDTFMLSLGYTHGIDALSYDHTLSLRLGVTFE